jgi:NAD(P)-dependent dehydrogenase (short-subunit alcohol dehydrogenase family)
MKVALVTGSAKRIGRAVALGLAQDGYTLAIHANTSIFEAKTLADEINAQGGKAAAFQADLSNPDTYIPLMDAITAQLGAVTCLVNSASLFEPDEAPELSPELFAKHMAINLQAPVFLAQEMAKRLNGQKGVVINFIDQRVWALTPKFGSYTLSKAALWTATQTLAQALAPHVRVAAIGPGPTLPNTRQGQEDFDKQARAVLLQAHTTLDDVLRAVRFILDTPSFTGQMIALDGGQHLAWQTPDVVGIKE